MDNKLKDIIAQHNNQYWKVLPNNLSPQCFDLAIGWTDSLGVPHYPNNPSPFPYANASQIYTDYGSWQAQYFDRIANSPTAVPKAGDIVVWSNSYGGVGHVAVATGVGDTNTFQAFSQNDPIGSKCVLKTYNYTYVLGWLRYNKPLLDQPTPVQPDCKVYTDEIVKLKQEISFKDKVIGDRDKELSDKTTIIDQMNQQMTLKSANIDTLTKQNEQLAEQLKVCQQQLDMNKDCQTNLLQAREQVQALETMKTVWTQKEEEYNRSIAQYKYQLTTIKSPIKVILMEILKRLS